MSLNGIVNDEYIIGNKMKDNKALFVQDDYQQNDKTNNSRFQFIPEKQSHTTFTPTNVSRDNRFDRTIENIIDNIKSDENICDGSILVKKLESIEAIYKNKYDMLNKRMEEMKKYIIQLEKKNLNDNQINNSNIEDLNAIIKKKDEKLSHLKEQQSTFNKQIEEIQSKIVKQNKQYQTSLQDLKDKNNDMKLENEQLEKKNE